jgi:low affinity Fe/Cu permease
MAKHRIQKLLTSSGALTSRPQAFLIVVIYTGLWLVFQRESFDWHAVATLATWTMTLVIQRAEHRDTQALHAKLDELLHAHKAARNGLTRLDQKEPEEIEEFRSEATQND